MEIFLGECVVKYDGQCHSVVRLIRANDIIHAKEKFRNWLSLQNFASTPEDIEVSEPIA